MKLFLSIALVVMVVVGCQQPQIVTYNLTENHPLIPQCERGKGLFNIYCASCHNTGKNKEVIPDFNSSQLSSYVIRLSNTKHDGTLTEEKIPDEELDLIITFLRFKKANPVAKSKR